MKTAVFEYTHKTEVDSSLAQAVYYNADEQAMAIEFHDGAYQTGSAIYGEVPEAFYRGFVGVDSIGRVYNSYVKHTFPSLSEGTVYDVTYTDSSAKIENAPVEKAAEKPETLAYEVRGYVRHVGKILAGSRKEAAEKFAASLTDEGYLIEDIAVTEVTLNIE